MKTTLKLYNKCNIHICEVNICGCPFEPWIPWNIVPWKCMYVHCMPVTVYARGFICTYARTCLDKMSEKIYCRRGPVLEQRHVSPDPPQSTADSTGLFHIQMACVTEGLRTSVLTHNDNATHSWIFFRQNGFPEPTLVCVEDIQKMIWSTRACAPCLRHHTEQTVQYIQ